MLRKSRVVLTLYLFALAACNTAGSSSTVPAQTSQTAALSNVARAALKDDWVTFGHDYMRTGFQPQSIGVSPRNVKGMTLRWKANIGSAACTTAGAPPCWYGGILAYGGNIVITSFYGVVGQWETASVYDYQAMTGKLLWRFQLPDQVRATPSIDPGQNLVIVATHPGDYAKNEPLPGTLFAIDLTTGKLKWSTKLRGDSHGAAVVANGSIYIGTGGGDEPWCFNGGVSAYDETSGKLRWTWLVNSQKRPKGGGSSWGAIGYDGVHLLVPTGNTCPQGLEVMTADGVVALDPKNGKPAWSFAAQQNSYDDDDTGGGVTFSKGQAIFINKNGTVYSVNATNGAETWATPVNPIDGQGGIATPSTDGTTVVVGAGTFRPSGATAKRIPPFCPELVMPHYPLPPGYVSYIEGFDADLGTLLWKRETTQTMNGDAAIVDGLAFTAIGNKFVALRLRTGATLWSYKGAGTFDPAPAVVPSGVYAADNGGNVYAFNLPAK
jgi:outer membrane protein assembly factor BamB